METTSAGLYALPHDSNGGIELLIIPYQEAAPTGDTEYLIQGNLLYEIGNSSVKAPLEPSPITVKPDANLEINYFWQRNIIADDPFTEEVEPSEPFTLGMAIQNKGYGAARNTKLVSPQPEILDNEKGLLISFRILGATLGLEQMESSLEVSRKMKLPKLTCICYGYHAKN